MHADQQPIQSPRHRVSHAQLVGRVEGSQVQNEIRPCHCQFDRAFVQLGLLLSTASAISGYDRAAESETTVEERRQRSALDAENKKSQVIDGRSGKQSNRHGLFVGRWFQPLRAQLGEQDPLYGGLGWRLDLSAKPNTSQKVVENEIVRQQIER
ncbi:hypothetical protein [Bradyrhizobium sp. SYSU BS000235]|uniref:hypothetical protein n=1 Tax=Bradyrhizobium sp. SYSU BS000235 TaxID=3411332 RepID=UPI003C711A38